MNKQSNDTRTPPLLHAARLVFPPLAALVVLVLTEWIARGTLDADRPAAKRCLPGQSR